MSAAEAENSHETASPRPGEPGAGRPFQPGTTGNPGGRPKGIASKVRELFDDDDGETIIRFLQGVMAGEVVTINVDAKNGAQTRSYAKANVKERLEAAKLLMERGWGKPPQFAPIEGDDPLDLSERQAADVASQLDARVDELAEKRERREAEAAEAAEA